MGLFWPSSFLFYFLPHTYMADTEELNTTIENFIRDNLYPTPEERKSISEKYNELKNNILPSNIHIFQSGSYARTTANTPVWDLDVICDIDDPDRYIPILLQLLESAYKGRATIKKQAHSIGIYFGADTDFSIDVVPVRQAKELPKNEFGLHLYEMPDFLKHSKKWRKAFYESNAISHSDPEWYREQALEVDKRSEWRFKRVVKFLKRWNYEVKQQVKNNEFTSFKSFHIEEIIKSYYLENPSLWIYHAIERFYNEWMNFLQEPHFLDRAAMVSGQEFYIDEYVKDISIESKRKMQEHLIKWVELMELAEISNQWDIEGIIKRLLCFPTLENGIPEHTTVPKHSGSHYII